jgi:peptide/nickel transport system substrate-binding protein
VEGGELMKQMKQTGLVVFTLVVLLSVLYTANLSSVAKLERESVHPVNGMVLSAGDLKNPDQYIYEIEGSPRTFDPAVSYDFYSVPYAELAYECLVNFKGDSLDEMEGELATGWTVIDGGLTYRFTLRQGVTFHDGTVFNAYVMKYSLDRAVIMNPYITMYGGEPAIGLQQAIEGGSLLPDAVGYLKAGGIVVIDDYTLEIHLQASYAAFIHVLAFQVASAVSPVAVIEHTPEQPGMVSLADWFGESFDPSKLGLPAGHDLASSGVVPQQENDWMTGNAVGTGPYKIVEVNWGSEIRLEKNTEWWGTFAEYSVNEVVFKTVESVEERLQHLKAGEADEISMVPRRLHIRDYSYADEVIDSEGNPVIEGTRVFDPDRLFVSPLGMNQHDTLPYWLIVEDESSTYDPASLARYAWGTQKASADNPLTSLLFRKAVALSFDCDTFITETMHGIGECMEGIIPDGLFGHNDQLIEDGYIPTYNPDAARELFQEIGWRGTITLPYAQENPALQQGYQQLANSITSLGVGIIVDALPVTWPQYIGIVRADIHPISFCTWKADYADPDNFAIAFLHTVNGLYPNRLGFSNPELNALIDQAAISPISNREELYHQIEEIAAMDYLYIYASEIHDLHVTRDWIIGYESSGSLNPTSFFTNVEHVGKALPASVEIVPKVVNTVRGSPWITLYIELPYGIDPMEIDLSTVTMSYEDFSQPAVTDPSYAWVTDPAVYIVDQDGDGILERLVRISRDVFVAGIDITDPGRRGTEIGIMVVGSLLDGTPFVAWSTVTIVSRGR